VARGINSLSLFRVIFSTGFNESSYSELDFWHVAARRNSHELAQYGNGLIGRYANGYFHLFLPCRPSFNASRFLAPSLICEHPIPGISRFRLHAIKNSVLLRVIQQLTVSQYLNRGPLRQKPTAHLPYNEGLHLVRAFIEFSSNHTVEDLQAFTAQWVPHPQWVKVIDVTIPDAHLDRAASLLQDQLGQDGIQMVGGRKWWQWRKPNSPLTAEWIEMREDYNERKKNGDPGKRVMYYVHGGAYYFGSVDEHRYQLQRHARKLKARVFAPEYRLAPQFPFPCGLQDCLAGYLYLLTVQEPSTIVLAGDSAGAGMIVSTMVTLRDRGLPLPAGAVLISPWVDLTHSFPSMAAEQPMDFIPAAGFHHKPSRAWPPPNEDDIEMMREQVGKLKGKGKGAVKRELPVENRHSLVQEAKDEEDKEEGPVDRSDPPHGVLEIAINGKTVLVKDQIQVSSILPEADLEL